ncbi:MAG TPA: DUF6152 family protein [Candidatus Acidoferrum sp.]|nr:DUF6152 family protein [Candidatus Acidoferrum sp.]
MKRLSCALVVAVLAGSLPPLVQAHHSFSAEFTDTKGEIHGVVTSGRFSNPHPRYMVEVAKKDGTKETWELEGSSATTLGAAGWTADFLKPGDEITVRGSLGRDGARKMFIEGVTKANGQVFPPANVTKRDPNQVHATKGKNYGYAKVNAKAPFDISGPWRNSYKFHVTVDDLDPKPTPFSAEGKALFAKTVHHDDYSLRCVAPGLPRIFGAPYDMEIVDGGMMYEFVYIEHNTPRRIYMDGRTAPADYPGRPMGFSVGHWEGNELVIETTHLAAGWLDGSGLPLKGGPNSKIVERYTFADDRLSMERVMTITDDYYTKPLVRHRASARDDDLKIVEHDSCDPTTYYWDLLQSNELEARIKALL